MESNPEVGNPKELNAEQIDDEKLELDLLQLNRYLAGLKKDRQQTEKDARILRDRNRVLSQEENKVVRKYEQETKNQENIDRIRVKVLQDKEMMEESKKKKNEKLEEQKIKNNNLKSGIDNTMKNWRPTLTLKNKNHADLIVKERNRIKNAIKINKERQDNENKEIREAVQQDYVNYLEQKKIEEKQRKLELKKKYEEMIQKELEMKNKWEEKIVEQKEKNDEILKRIKDYNDNLIGNKHYSVSVKKLSKRNTTANLKTRKDKKGI